MVKTLAVAILILAAAKAGPNKHKELVKQCRIQVTSDVSSFVYTSDWMDCKTVEIVAEDLFMSMPRGTIIWTEEQTKIKNKWSEPKKHTKPEEVPLDALSKDRNNS